MTETLPGEIIIGIDTHKHTHAAVVNVFVERLWRSVKYEEIYLKAYDTVAEARNSLATYFGFYNSRRPHSSLDRQTPDQAYFTPLPQIAAA